LTAFFRAESQNLNT